MECYCAEFPCQAKTPADGAIIEYAACDLTLYIFQQPDWEGQERWLVLVKTSTQEVVGAGYRSDVPVCDNGDNAWIIGESLAFSPPWVPGCVASSCQAHGVWQQCP